MMPVRRWRPAALTVGYYLPPLTGKLGRAAMAAP